MIETIDSVGGKHSLRSQYEQLATIRQPYLRRARDCARLTIPRVIPEAGSNGSTDFIDPFQSVGARGVNNLTSKLLMALFPPNVPFFKFQVAPYAAKQIGGTDAETEIEQKLTTAEKAIQAELETSGFRVRAYEALQQLLIAGNVLLHMPSDDTTARLYRIDQYVVKRDSMGRPLKIIVREVMTEEQLPEDIRGTVVKYGQKSDTDSLTSEPTYELYTGCCWNEKLKTWEVYQECGDILVPESEGVFTRDSFTYIPLRGYHSSGEDYSRSYVEDYLGDLISLEGLSQAIMEGAAAAARILFLVKPGVTDINTISKAPNGAFREGVAEDVKAIGLDKFGDFNVASQTAQNIESRLSLAFLLNTAVQRNGERVTAEEIRFMAQELEQILGGAYSLLSLEFQLPLVNLLIYRMIKQGTLPRIPKKLVKPTIVTGIEALGRGNDLSRLRLAMGTMREMLGESVGASIRVDALLKRVFTAAGVDSESLILTPEEVAQQRNAAAMQEMAGKLGPEVIRQMGQQAQGTAQ